VPLLRVILRLAGLGLSNGVPPPKKTLQLPRSSPVNSRTPHPARRSSPNADLGVAPRAEPKIWTS
jgi:hypothetical protein